MTLLLLAVLCASLFVHLSFRNDHFQGCDSCSMYEVIYDYPNSAKEFNDMVYGNFLFRPDLMKSGGKEDVKNVIKRDVYYYKNFIIQKVTGVNGFLPHWLNAGFAAALGGTLSFGPGLIDGLISSPGMSFKPFLSRAMVVTIFLFHLSVLLVYLISRRLKFSSLACFIGALFMLFSISLYSHGYHQSSTIWNIASGSLLLWTAVFYWDRDPLKKYLRRLAWLTGALVFFNYLIVFYWLPILGAIYVLKKNEISAGGFIGKIFFLLKTQWPAILLVAICGFLFFQPGLGFRGTASGLREFFMYTYYIILNFFSLYNQSSLIDSIQFVFFSVLLVVGLGSLIQPIKENTTAGVLFKYFLLFFIILFILACLVRVLGFIPTRHILFLAPPLFVLLTAGINYFFMKFKINRLGWLAAAVLVVVGFFAVGQRMVEAFDNVKYITIDKDISEVVVGDCSFNVLYKDFGKPTVFYRPEDLSAGNTYLYIGQATPFQKPIEYLKKNNLAVKVLASEQVFSDVFFEAYHPDSAWYDARPNGKFITKFKVYPIK